MPDGWVSDKSAKYNVYYPVKEDILQYGTPVSWKEMMKISGLKRVGEVAFAMHARLFGGFAKNSHHRMLSKLEAAMDTSLFYPEEDELSLFLLEPIRKLFSSKGARKIEYMSMMDGGGSLDILNASIEDLSNLCTGPVTVKDENADFVLTCYFDGNAALFFSKEENLHDLLAGTGLEGVIYKRDTPLAWERSKVDYFG
ncbi:hypothetical protein BSG1_04130 [Bacillus sp. SG-1]|nr:hypothetical protein BSG1_04130 [Bacillus sp. SG-1]